MLSVIMLIVKLNVANNPFILNVIMLSVVTPCINAANYFSAVTKISITTPNIKALSIKR